MQTHPFAYLLSVSVCIIFFGSTKAELSSCSRGHMAPKPKTFTLLSLENMCADSGLEDVRGGGLDLVEEKHDLVRPR